MKTRFVLTAAAVSLFAFGCFNPVGGENVMPGQVVDVIVAANSLSSVTVTWTEITDDETLSAEMSYEIHLSTTAEESAAAFSVEATVVGGGAAVLNGIPGYTTIYVSVRAVDADGAAGAPSAEATAATTATIGFVDGGDAEVDAPLTSTYQATLTDAESVNGNIYLTWNDNAGSAFEAAVLPAGGTSFTLISDGTNLPYWNAAGGGSDLYIAGNAAAATVYRYNPAPADNWTDVTGSAPSGDSDDYVLLGEVNDSPHLLVASIGGGGTTYTARLLERGASDWSEVSGSPIFVRPYPAGAWFSTPLDPVGVGDTIYVVGSPGGEPEVFLFDGASWSDISDPTWASPDNPKAVVTSSDSVYLVTLSAGIAKIWEYSGSGTVWNVVQSDIRYDVSELVQDLDAMMLNGTLYVSWTETSATLDRTRLGAYAASATIPNWQIIDGTGADGLNSDPLLYDSRQPALLAHEESVYLFFTEDDGVATNEILQAYKFE